MSDVEDRQPLFAANGIEELLDLPSAFNLAESTTPDLSWDELLAIAGPVPPQTSLGYGSSAGLPRLREAIASMAAVRSDEVITTQGAIQALLLVATELCRAGDEVVVTTPCFPPAIDGLVMTGARVRPMKLTFESGYAITADKLAPLLTARTRLVSLASPQNPSGVMLSRDSLNEIVTVVARRAPLAWVLVDETYLQAGYVSAPSPSAILDHPGIIVCSSLSKAFGAPGLRVGWVICRNAALRQRLTRVRLNVGLSCSSLCEALGAGLIEQRATFLAERARMLSTALATTAIWFDSERDRLQWIRPDRGALCVGKLSADRFDDSGMATFWDVLRESGVLLARGSWFGEQDDIFRLGFGYPPPKGLSAGLSKITAAMDAAEPRLTVASARQ